MYNALVWREEKMTKLKSLAAEGRRRCKHNRKSPHDFHRKGLISMEPIVRFELTTY